MPLMGRRRPNDINNTPPDPRVREFLDRLIIASTPPVPERPPTKEESDARVRDLIARLKILTTQRGDLKRIMDASLSSETND